MAHPGRGSTLKVGSPGWHETFWLGTPAKKCHGYWGVTSIDLTLKWGHVFVKENLPGDSSRDLLIPKGWRSLNLWRGHLTIAKRAPAELPAGGLFDFGFTIAKWRCEPRSSHPVTSGDVFWSWHRHQCPLCLTVNDMDVWLFPTIYPKDLVHHPN